MTSAHDKQREAVALAYLETDAAPRVVAKGKGLIAEEIIARARKGGGPALLECKMVRFHGHFEGDAQTYRAPGELEDIRSHQDCLKKFAAAVTGAGVVSAAELQAIDHEVLGIIERAVVEAKAAPLPTAADLLTDVYVKF